MRNGRIGRGVLLAVIPFVLVTVGCARKPQYVGRVEIVGDVELPGFYGMTEGQNAKAVVNQAGEVDEENTKYVLLYHAGEKEPYRTMLLRNFRDYAHEITLKPDDVVVFSRIAKPEYYLSANVETGGAHPWLPDMTVSEAISATGLEGQSFLQMGIRVSRYAEKGGGRVARRADRIFPGDTILLYDLYQATVPRKERPKPRTRKKPIIVDEDGKLRGAEALKR